MADHYTERYLKLRKEREAQHVGEQYQGTFFHSGKHLVVPERLQAGNFVKGNDYLTGQAKHTASQIKKITLDPEYTVGRSQREALQRLSAFDVDAGRSELESLTNQSRELKATLDQARYDLSGVGLYSAQPRSTQEYRRERDAAAAYRESQERIAALKSDLAQAETIAEWRRYRTIPEAADFAELSKYVSTKNGKEAKMNYLTGKYIETGYDDVLYDAINGDETAQNHLLNYETGRRYDYKGLDRQTVQTFNYIYRTQNREAAYDYLDMVAGRKYNGEEALALGVMQGTGLASLSAALGGGLSKLTGNEEMEERNRAWYGEFLRDAAGAREQHGAAYGVGAVGGNLALMYGIGKGLGAVSNALSAGVRVGGTTVTVQMSPAVQNIAGSSLNFLAADAVQNAGAVSTGYMSVGDYVKSAGISGVQGLAGSLAGGLVGSGMANILRDRGLMTPFMEFVRQTTTGFAAAGTNIGTGYFLRGERPSREQVAMDLTTAFLFSVIQGGISTYTATRQNRAKMETLYEKILSEYQNLSQGWREMSPEARAESCRRAAGFTQDLRSSLNSYYMAGQQAVVNDMNAALDAVDFAIRSYAGGFRSGPSAVELPGNGMGSGTGIYAASVGSGDLAVWRGQLQRAMEQGFAAPEGGGTGTAEAPRSGFDPGVFPAAAAAEVSTPNFFRGKFPEQGAAQAGVELQKPVSLRETGISQETAAAVPGGRGQTVSAYRRLAEAARTFGRLGAKVVLAFYDGVSDPVAYYGGFAAYYQAGCTGRDMAYVSDRYAGALNTAQQQAAYLAGQTDAELQSESGNTGGREKSGLRKTPGKYRATKPQNVELPTVPIINLSMSDVAEMNAGTLPKAGNTLRNTAISRARRRLGLDRNSAAYIPASNVMRDGKEYILKITKATLNKMLSPSDDGVIPLENVLVLENIERIANNGVWFDGQGDRKGRDQIAGYDHLKTTVYIDGRPYLVDIRVRLVQETPKKEIENVLYYYTPEELVGISEVDTGSPTGMLREHTGAQRAVPTSDFRVPQVTRTVKAEVLPEKGRQGLRQLEEKRWMELALAMLRRGEVPLQAKAQALGLDEETVRSLEQAAREVLERETGREQSGERQAVEDALELLREWGREGGDLRSFLAQRAEGAASLSGTDMQDRLPEETVRILSDLARGMAERSMRASENGLQDRQRDATMDTTTYSLKEGEDHGEKRKESRRSFLARMYEGTRKGGEIGEIAYAYIPVRSFDTSVEAKRAQKELDKLGVKNFFHAGLEYNVDGITRVDRGEAATLGTEIVAILGSAVEDGKNIAGHEFFHVKASTSQRRDFEAVFRENVDVFSVYALEQADIVLRDYLGGSLTDKALFFEEFLARISGQLHSELYDVELSSMFRDFEAVKAAWKIFTETHIPDADEK